MLHDRWPEKKIWVTELTPGIGGDEAPDCLWQVEGKKTWMKKVVAQVRDWECVENIFWNAGTWVCVDSLFIFMFSTVRVRRDKSSCM